MPLDVLLLVAGLALLYFGGEWLVRSAAGLARRLGVEPLLIGLTVVAFGTSAPEAVVSLIASWRGNAEIALGNVVGSNIANVGVILGLAALIRPPEVDRALIQRDVPVLLASAFVIPLLLLDGVIGRGEGGALLLAGFVYVWISVRGARREGAAAAAGEIEVDAERAGAPHAESPARLAIIGVGGLAALVLGGECLVRGATGIARSLGMGEDVIGLTIVSVGTSLPELATTLVAAFRGHSAIAVGNVVGSNIFNVLYVLGSAALVRPIPAALADRTVDLVALAVASVAVLVLLRTARRVTRGEGVALLLGYVAFVVLLLL